MDLKPLFVVLGYTEAYVITLILFHDSTRHIPSECYLKQEMASAGSQTNVATQTVWLARAATTLQA